MRESRERDGSRAPFDPVTMLFHWLTAVMVGFQFLTGYAMAFEPALIPPLLVFHRSLGATVLAITGFRLIWRLSFARFPPFPPDMPRVLAWLARRSEHALYFLLLLQPITGLAASILRGRAFAVLGFQVPILLPRNPELWFLLQSAHRTGALALAVLAGSHAMMALVHHYLLRDDVLAMMAPWVRSRTAKTTRKAHARAVARVPASR